jgi:hypothetical protein
MTQTFDVSRVVPSITVAPTGSSFILRWFIHSSPDALKLQIYDSPSIFGVLGPLLRETTLPLPIAKTEVLGEFNRGGAQGSGTNTDFRRTHHFMMGANGKVSKHSIVGNTRFHDGRVPYLFVWDWEIDNLFTLTLEDPTTLIEGPVKLGERLYFFAIDDSDDVGTLYSCLTDLTDLSAHGDAGVMAGPLEYMIATNDHISGLRNLGNAVVMPAGPVWPLASINDPAVETTYGVGSGQIWERRYGDHPGQVDPTTNTGFLFKKARPNAVLSISTATVVVDDILTEWTGGSPIGVTYWTLEQDTTIVRVENQVGSGSPPPRYASSSAFTAEWSTGGAGGDIPFGGTYLTEGPPDDAYHQNFRFGG